MPLTVKYEEIIRPELQRAAQRIKSLLLSQVPVDTGALRDSIKVSVIGSEIVLEYLEYGVYTDSGTYDNYDSRSRRPYIDKYIKSPKKRGKGIPPSYWTSISEADYKFIQDITAKKIAQVYERAVLKAIDKL